MCVCGVTGVLRRYEHAILRVMGSADDVSVFARAAARAVVRARSPAQADLPVDQWIASVKLGADPTPGHATLMEKLYLRSRIRPTVKGVRNEDLVSPACHCRVSLVETECLLSCCT